ncbi:MAG: Transcriptional regulator, IclR family [Rhizobacter sp.]|nr:Transcriptional regulator, IclR family [Rhizobacter sp.]
MPASRPPAALPDDAEPEAVRRSRVSGIDRALQVLDHLQRTGAPAAPYAMAKELGLPLSTAYVLIDGLVERNLLARRADGTVWLGARLYHYGLSYAHSLDFLEVATHEMQRLRDEVGETVQVCARDGDDMVVVGMAEGPGHFQVNSRVGSRVPLNWTASGRLLVGHLAEAERRTLFERGAKASRTGRADTDAAHLARAAGEALVERLSIQIGESDYAVACIASPICDAGGACVATISIVLPEQRADKNQAHYIDAVKKASLQVQATLGWPAS